jgi:hypothetical protein
MSLCQIKDDKNRSSATLEGVGEEVEPCCLSAFLHPVRDDSGFVLILALIILVLITFLGIAALNTTTTERQIAASDRAYKQAFYNADIGISYAVEGGVAIFFPVSAVLTNLAAQPPGLSPDIHLQYIDIGTVSGGGRRVEVHSTGTSAGGGTSTIIAGLVGTVNGPVGGPNPFGYP